MSLYKPVFVALSAALLAFPAMAGGCFSIKDRGGNKSSNYAESVKLTFKNQTSNDVTVIATMADDSEMEISVPNGKTVSKRIAVAYGEKDDTTKIKLDYTTQVGTTSDVRESDLLDFKILNTYFKDGLSSKNVRQTAYHPSTKKKPKNITCDRTWRKKNKRWDLDIKFK